MPALSKPEPLVIAGVGLAVVVSAIGLQKLLGRSNDQSIASFWHVFTRYGNFDFVKFMAKHRASYEEGQRTGDFVPGVCNYYSLMSDFITATSGPFWHFVPMHKGLSRIQNHEKFHRTLAGYLEARQSDKILEIGCGYGEMGRQVAKISGAKVTGLTMADAEIVGANARIKEAGLQAQCNMVQGNYHNLPMEANSFDKVFGIYTLKYSADLQKAISEAARVLKPGGKFVSYEILVTDKYDPSNPQHKYNVENISKSTCMPPLWHAKDFREAAENAGLVPCQDEDLCLAKDVAEWYSCFTGMFGPYSILKSRLVPVLIGVAEALKILPQGLGDWYESCCVHPAADFVEAGRSKIVTGAVMMTWTKPAIVKAK